MNKLPQFISHYDIRCKKSSSYIPKNKQNFYNT
jgi:hypothetical protein